MAGAILALGEAVSAATKNQVIAFVVTAAISMVFMNYVFAGAIVLAPAANARDEPNSTVAPAPTKRLLKTFIPQPLMISRNKRGSGAASGCPLVLALH